MSQATTARVAAPAFDIRPLSGALGAEIRGLNLSRGVDAKTAEALRQAWHEHVVLLFRDQKLTPQQQIAFTNLFGPAEPHPLGSRATVPDRPEVLVLENKPGQRGARNDIWHSDISFWSRPPSASILHGHIVPEGRGDTMFCNMYAAYEGLTDGLKATLRGLKAMHSAAGLQARNNEGGNDGKAISRIPDPACHPVVRRHPGSGRLALFVNPWFTQNFEGWSVAESRPLLDYLVAQATQHENIYRHHWRQGDVIMWDNRAAMHYAVRDYDEFQPRLMHRTTAGGEVPESA